MLQKKLGTVVLFLLLCACQNKKGYQPLTEAELNNARQIADVAVTLTERNDLTHLYDLYHPEFRKQVTLEQFSGQFQASVSPFGRLSGALYRNYKEDTRFFAESIGLQRVLRFYYAAYSSYPDTTILVEVVSTRDGASLSRLEVTSPAAGAAE